MHAPQIISGFLFTIIILGFLYNTSKILNYTMNHIGVSLKFLWFFAVVYDLTTSYLGNIIFLLNNNEPNSMQIVILMGLTFFVSSSPILLSLLINSESKDFIIRTKSKDVSITNVNELTPFEILMVITALLFTMAMFSPIILIGVYIMRVHIL